MSSDSMPVYRSGSQICARPGVSLTLRALWKLAAHDLFLRRHSTFADLHQHLRSIPVAPCTPAPDAIERVKAAIDEACIWYPKRAVCLQRSAVAVALLRSLGVRAQFVYGVQQLPFKAHAWVEVGGMVVNDRQDVQQEYFVMERI
jgi:hypothetical protein